MGTRAVAERLHVDVRTVHRLVARAELEPAYRGDGLRGVLLFDRVEVERLASTREKEPA